jgi:SAM-dependent methyltransferase
MLSHGDSAAQRALTDETYRARLREEEKVYENCLHVHDLPAIFHYWSNTYIRPKMEAFGFSNPNQLFCKRLQKQCERHTARDLRFVSIGSGNCDLEIEIALHLCSQGHSFVIECVDLNPAMLERGQAAAHDAGMGSRIHTVQADLNEWNPEAEYDAVIANQALHHVLNLEGLFARVKASLKPQGCFVISDIIGRNGHERWPEALEIVQEYWRKLPPSYRLNRQLDLYEELYQNRSCSGESFEGIRSQDILPLLVERFHFQLFLAFANVIDPFVDRSFGPNFDATADWDRAFIDRVHHRDEEELTAGRIKPTHMLAVVGNERDVPTVFHPPMRPEFCMRPPLPVSSVMRAADAYDWGAWPHSPFGQLEFACRRLADTENRLRQVDKEIEARTAWARGLETQVNERTAWALRLEKDVEERTTWARGLEKEMEERTAWAQKLDGELKRVLWAWRLDYRLRRLRHYVRRLLFRRTAKE